MTRTNSKRPRRPLTWPKSNWPRKGSSSFSHSCHGGNVLEIFRDFGRCCFRHCCCHCCYCYCKVAVVKSCCCYSCGGCWRLDCQSRHRRRHRPGTRTGLCATWGWWRHSAASFYSPSTCRRRHSNLTLGWRHSYANCLTVHHWRSFCPWVEEGTAASSLSASPFRKGAYWGGRGANKEAIYFGCRH